MKNKIINLFLMILLTVGFADAQTTEVKISLDEQFFEALFEAVFTHLEEPSMPISGVFERELNESEQNGLSANETTSIFQNAAFEQDRDLRSNNILLADNSATVCNEAIYLKRDVEGVKTAVRFRQGKIIAPIAFRGVYNPPLIGCIEFNGWAETNIELKFDQNKQALVGNAKVLNVNMSGTGGVGSSLLARFVQNSIDKKVNPLEIIKMDKLSFLVPVQKAGNLRMKALGMRHVINERSIDIYLKYQFLKG